ncbi:SDR family oxidoreductase [soil metagenome]
MKKLVVVTGGAGFLGSHLCDRLLERGHRVVALDDMSTGAVAHVEHLLDHPDFKLIEHDVAQPFPTELHGAWRVFNLACPASPAYYQSRPVHTTLTSVLGAWRLMEFARSSGARVLQASTSEVYGDPQVHPQTEGYFGHVNPIGVRSCYDEGKRCAEAMMFAYAREFSVDIRVVRLFNSYGPRLSPGDGRVVSNFIVQALRGEPLTVYGDGQQTRSFCYVDDTVEGILRAMDSDFVGPVNLGNPVEHTVLELANEVLRLTRSESRLVRMPLPADDPTRRRPDISLARELLDWAPQVSLAEGLEATIDYMRSELGLEVDRAPTDLVEASTLQSVSNRHHADQLHLDQPRAA